MATEYILTDRTLLLNYSIQVDDSQLKFTSTVSASSSEPIVQDKVNLGVYWKIFIDNEQLGYESTATVQDDLIELDDLTTSDVWTLEVRDGQLYMNNGSILIAIGIPWIRRRRR